MESLRIPLPCIGNILHFGKPRAELALSGNPSWSSVETKAALQQNISDSAVSTLKPGVNFLLTPTSWRDSKALVPAEHLNICGHLSPTPSRPVLSRFQRRRRRTRRCFHLTTASASARLTWLLQTPKVQSNVPTWVQNQAVTEHMISWSWSIHRQNDRLPSDGSTSLQLARISYSRELSHDPWLMEAFG